MNVVIGAGYVGLATAAALSADGQRAIVYDTNAARLEEHAIAISVGVDPLMEPGLRDLMDEVVFSEVLPEQADTVFVCVGTPARDGTLDCSAVESVVRDVMARYPRATVVVRSTITPECALRMIAETALSSARPGERERLMFAPEFLREGHVAEDVVRPTRVVVGHFDNEPGARRVAKLLLTPTPPFLLGQEEAVLVKLLSNGFIALKAMYAQAVADVCEATTGADSQRVLKAMAADHRIGSMFVGLGVGGPCLPKDITALQKSFPAAFEPFGPVYDRMMDVDWTFNHVMLNTEEDAPVLMIGIGFKPDSPDWRTSPALDLAVRLGEAGRIVEILDERLTHAEKRALTAHLSTLFETDTPPVRVRGWVGLPLLSYGAEILCMRSLEPGYLELDGLVVDPYGFAREFAEDVKYRYVGRGLGPGDLPTASDLAVQAEDL